VFSGFGGNSGVGRTSYEHFVQEAFALSRLTHPNTLRIYDFGHLGPKDAEGMPLQVCEYMNGGTLSHIIRDQGNQSLDETARMSARCASRSVRLTSGHRPSRHQAAEHPVRHRGRQPAAQLADFGIAKWSTDDENKEQRAEDTAIVAGQKLRCTRRAGRRPSSSQARRSASDRYLLAGLRRGLHALGQGDLRRRGRLRGYRKRRHADQLVREALEPLAVPRR